MGKFKAPTADEIKELSNEDLAAKIAEAQEAYAPLEKIENAELSDEQADDIVAIGDFFSVASEESESREAAATERTERLANARQKMARKDEDEDEDDEDEVDPRGDVIPDEDEEDEEDKRKRTSSDDDALTAAGKAKQKRRKVPQSKQRKTEEANGPSLTAAADVPGFPSGQKFDSLTAAGPAIMKRLQGLPTGKVPNTRIRNGAVVINMPKSKLSQDNYIGRDSEMLLSASQESRLEGDSLTAAGGWGAPSNQVLDFCGGETTDGLVDLPEVTITRGGVNYTKGPSFDSVMNSGTGFWDQTEAVAEAGTEEKTALRPEVPGFIDKRLDAVGHMMEAGLLLRAGWPELVDRYAELSLVAHQHKMASKVIREVEAYTGAAINVPNGFGNAMDVLHVLELVAIGERERNAMALNSTLEVWLPHWVKAIIRADLANRAGVTDSLSVPDSQIDSFFTARNLRVQWLYGYQNLDVATNGIATAYPDFVESIMYPAGTYVKGVSDVITLDTIYDSVNLKLNDYVHLFTEQGLTVTNPCNDGRRISLPIAANGRTGAADISRDLFVAAEPVA